MVAIPTLMADIKNRLSKVFQKTASDAIILMNTDVTDSNLAYLTGMNGVFEQSIAIATKSGVKFLTYQLEYQSAMVQRPKNVTVVNIDSKTALQRELSALKGKTIGVNESFLPYRYYRFLKKHTGAKKMKDASAELARARSVKDADEIHNITVANRIAKKAFNQIADHFEQGVSEKQMAAAFDNLMRLNGADEPSFRTIVAFGSNTAMPHHFPNNTRLRPNSLIIIDAGAKYRNYCSDITRTFIFKPEKRSPKYARMLEVYDTVKKAQKLAFNTIKPGTLCGEVHDAADRFINSVNNGAYKGRFIHALGHSIGLDVHDPGFYISHGSDTKLGQGMVFSDEPGIYIPGFGGVRIEDDVVVTKGGAKML